MPELRTYWLLVTFVALAAVGSFVALLRVTAPYGRHTRPGWGPTVPARTGWIVMESPAVILFLAIYAAGSHAAERVPLVLLALWQLHYLTRTFVYPMRLRDRQKRMPVAIVAMAIVFNTVNAYVNARWLSEFGRYGNDWLLSPAFIAGSALFAAGFAVNQHADTILMRLREPGGTGYRVPEGGLYRWVSCPNYLGEMLEWLGFALATLSPGAAAFALFTIANLGPRAVANHRWYRQQFPDYPPARRALIPGIL